MLSQLWNKLTHGRRRAGYHSRFGGLWTDRTDALVRLAERERSGAVDAEEARRLRHWIEEGYVVLEGAVPGELCDRLRADVEDAWERRDERLRIEIGGELHGLDPELRDRRYKLLDLYVHSEAALEAAFAEPVRAFLASVFEDDVLLFQSLNFESGSEQAVHQDTAYVVVTPPMSLAASWLALEDVRPGSGELVYYPGSHRVGEHVFRGGARHWNRERDGEAAREGYEAALHEKAAGSGLELARFLPKKGDVLIWSADLAHGGAPITDPAVTRRSYVCHYCPRSARPYYFNYKRAHRAVRPVATGCAIASSHFELADR